MNSPFDYREGKVKRHRDYRGNVVEHRTVEAYLGNELVARLVEGDDRLSNGNGCGIYTKQYESDTSLRYESGEINVAKAKWYLNNAWNDPELRAKVFGGVKEKAKTANVAYLPSGDSSAFYPTPDKLAGKMLGKVDWRKVSCILEPEAGKGDLVEAIQRFVEVHRYTARDRTAVNNRLYYTDSGRYEADIDCIEKDYDLRLILRGKGLRLVGEDFLAYETQKAYSLICMNPPFFEGAEHLLKAISMQKRTGGQIVCLLNAETILNPYNNIRKELKAELDKLGASIEIVHDAFRKAERKTDVSVAIVYLCIDKPKRESKIFDEMKKAQEAKYADDAMREQSLVYGDYIDRSIQHFRLEASVGRELIEEYASLLPNIMDSRDTYASPLLMLKAGNIEIDKPENVELAVNEYLRSLRYKYWRMYLDRPEIQEKLTSKMSDDYYNKLKAMAEYDYSRHNIMQLNYDMQMQLLEGVKESIIELFEKLSREHAYYEGSPNIHYYNGWKTNKAWKVTNKAIIPAYGSYKRSVFKETWDDKITDEIDPYDAARIISDLEKTLNYLNKGEVSGVSIEGAINRANAKGSKTVSFTYFDVTFYKKGTAHIKFLPEAQPLLDRLNIFAAQERGWLPPNYGRTHYDDMTAEEKSVVDEFQGKKEYEKVMKNPKNYLLNADSLAGKLLTD